MFNIALINLADDFESEYIKDLQEKNWIIHTISSDRIMSSDFEGISLMDAIIIKESSMKQMEQTCGLIIKVRSMSDCFIWVLSKETNKINRIIYLQLGADGTFDDGMDTDELGLYVSNTLNRRNVRIKEKSEQVVSKSGSVQLIPQKYAVDLEGREVSLTKLEFKLLEILYSRIGEVVSYEELYESIWGEAQGDRQYRVANLAFHLRRKIEEDISNSRYIKTVRSIGYMLHV